MAQVTAQTAFDNYLGFHQRSLMKQIDTFSSCGEVELRKVYLPDGRLVNWLQDLGYRVDHGSMDEPNCYTISWYKPEKK